MHILIDFFINTWNLTATMAPWLLFGFLIAGLLSLLNPSQWIKKNFGQESLKNAIKATLIGIPMPLCSCGIIPVAAAFKAHGAGKGPTIAFLTSTPQTGVDSIAATWGLMGPIVAIFRVVIAFITGILAGGIISAVHIHEKASQSSANETSPHIPNSQNLRGALEYAFIRLPQAIAVSLLSGLIVGGLLTTLIPANYLYQIIGTDIFYSYLLTTLIALPIYVCSTGSIPFAFALIQAGLPTGAALIFLTAGPATNTATIGMITQTMGKKTTLIYLAILSICSWSGAYFVDRILPLQDLQAELHLHSTIPSLPEQILGLGLLVILLTKWIPVKKS